MKTGISINELKKIINSCNIIDIRSIQSYNNNHINGAINIPMEKLIIDPSKYLKRNDVYYIYCGKGISSSKTCNILNKLGFNTINIIGGYEEWILNN